MNEVNRALKELELGEIILILFTLIMGIIIGRQTEFQIQLILGLASAVGILALKLLVQRVKLQVFRGVAAIKLESEIEVADTLEEACRVMRKEKEEFKKEGREFNYDVISKWATSKMEKRIAGTIDRLFGTTILEELNNENKK